MVTGQGVVSSLGHSADEFYNNLLAGKSGISMIEGWDTGKRQLGLLRWVLPVEMPECAASGCKPWRWPVFFKPWRSLHTKCPLVQLELDYVWGGASHQAVDVTVVACAHCLLLSPPPCPSPQPTSAPALRARSRTSRIATGWC